MYRNGQDVSTSMPKRAEAELSGAMSCKVCKQSLLITEGPGFYRARCSKCGRSAVYRGAEFARWGGSK